MNQTALITGASRGIGLGIARRLAEQGYSLTIGARDQDRLDVVANELVSAGARAVLPIAVDLADLDMVNRLTEEHGERYGSLDALVLNAGVGTSGTIAEYPAERVAKTVDVNLQAPFLLLHRALPLLRAAAKRNPSRGARVVALASIAGVYPEAGLALYGATKAALLSLVRTLNVEESGNGITASAIAPGYVDTDMSKWTHDSVPRSTMIEVADIVTIVDAVLALSPKAVIPEIVVTRAGTPGTVA